MKCRIDNEKEDARRNHYMAIPFEHIHDLLRSYARLDPSILMPDAIQLHAIDQGQGLVQIMSRQKKEQILNDVRLRVLEKIREHASKKTDP